jgi:hypothetical protein
MHRKLFVMKLRKKDKDVILLPTTSDVENEKSKEKGDESHDEFKRMDRLMPKVMVIIRLYLIPSHSWMLISKRLKKSVITKKHGKILELLVITIAVFTLLPL